MGFLLSWNRFRSCSVCFVFSIYKMHNLPTLSHSVCGFQSVCHRSESVRLQISLLAYLVFEWHLCLMAMKVFLRHGSMNMKKIYRKILCKKKKRFSLKTFCVKKYSQHPGPVQLEARQCLNSLVVLCCARLIWNLRGAVVNFFPDVFLMFTHLVIVIRK